MNAVQILTLGRMAVELVQTGLATRENLKAKLAALAPEADDETLNAIVAESRRQAQHGMTIADQQIQKHGG